MGGVLGTLAAVPAPAAPAGVIEVDVKLVIATDVSKSIEDERLALERQGIADTFLDPEVLKVITNGPLGQIAVAMVDWAGYRENQVVVDWTIVKDKASAAALAEKVLKIPRMPSNRTSISNAIERSIGLLDGSDNKILATRKVIDVSGDGPNNDGYSLEQIHEATKDNGIVVNGLPIMDESSDGYFPDLDKYYAACVVSGKGGFMVVVRSFKDFGLAMRRKIVVEVSQNETQIKQALGMLEADSLLQRVASRKSVTPLRPQFQRSAPEYPGGCDAYGGWSIRKP
jgi:hypothetical protein